MGELAIMYGFMLAGLVLVFGWGILDNWLILQALKETVRAQEAVNRATELAGKPDPAPLPQPREVRQDHEDERTG